MSFAGFVGSTDSQFFLDELELRLLSEVRQTPGRWVVTSVSAAAKHPASSTGQIPEVGGGFRVYLFGTHITGHRVSATVTFRHDWSYDLHGNVYLDGADREVQSQSWFGFVRDVNIMLERPFCPFCNERMYSPGHHANRSKDCAAQFGLGYRSDLHCINRKFNDIRGTLSGTALEWDFSHNGLFLGPYLRDYGLCNAAWFYIADALADKSSITAKKAGIAARELFNWAECHRDSEVVTELTLRRTFGAFVKRDATEFVARWFRGYGRRPRWKCMEANRGY